MVVTGCCWLSLPMITDAVFWAGLAGELFVRGPVVLPEPARIETLWSFLHTVFSLDTSWDEKLSFVGAISDGAD